MKLITYEKNGKRCEQVIVFEDNLTLDDFIRVANRGAIQAVKILDVKEVAFDEVEEV